MVLDPRTLGASFVLLSSMLGMLLLFSWIQNRRIHALVWWSATFCLIPIGIGMANLGQAGAGHSTLLVANALVMLGYGALHAGCRTFNGRGYKRSTIILGAVVWTAVFPFIHDLPSTRLVVASVITAAYAALSGWELWKHASQRLVSQRAAVILLFGLAVFNIFRGVLGLSLSSIFWIDVFASRWSSEMALLLVVYAPALAFIFLSMAKERIEADNKKAGQALQESEEHYRYTVELNPQIAWTADPDSNITSASSRWFDLTGIPVKEALGSGWIKALHPDDLESTKQRWSASLSTGEPFDAEYRVRLADGNYRWFRARAAARYDENGRIIRWYGTLEDVHESKIAEENLRWAAYHDDLTGLPNRRLLQERLHQALDWSGRTGRKVGLLIMDLDDFKQINDRFGHDTGDELLKVFSERLLSLVGPADTVARLGGDEFAIVLSDIKGECDVAAKARAIQDLMQNPFRLNSGEHDCRASIGGALSAGHDSEMGELMKQADLALYDCKTAGRGRFKVFAPAMREEAQKVASALERARRAVASEWIVPFYQPKIALHSGGLVGFEALLRWRHPEKGIQSPKTLAPAFDDVELGTIMGEHMLSCVLADMRRWLDAGLLVGSIAINASPAEIRQEDYAKQVLERLRHAGIPPSHLEVEITETVLLDHNAEHVERILRVLSAAGVTIALDDFGTGYASLSHLKRFPVDVIKIDRSFIGDMETDLGNAAIVKAVLSLGQNLGIKVIAEGVETAAQASFLRKHGCDLVQGFGFGRPMPASDVPGFIASSARNAEWMMKATNPEIGR